VANLRIERLIEIKEKLKEEKERELEEVKAVMQLIVSNIRDIEATINATYNPILTTTLSGEDFAVLKDYINYLNEKKTNLVAEGERVKKKVEVLRSQFFEMAKELKMFEKLKAKSDAVLKKSENRKEQKKLDAMALRGD
jgi:flagellar export protein FliJ